MQISLNKHPENPKAVGDFKKYLTGKCCVHSELSLHDSGKINFCGRKNKERGPLGQDTSVSGTKFCSYVGVEEDDEKGAWGRELLLFFRLEDSLT